MNGETGFSVLFGHKVDSKSETGFLTLDANGRPEIVDDITYARRFPNSDGGETKGFAPPDKWIKYFEEETIDGSFWKFHTVQVMS